MGWVADVAAEIDRLVVATYGAVGQALAADYPFPNAHPAIFQGVGTALLAGPVALPSLAATYPYLPATMLDALVQNNVDEGVLTLSDGMLVLADKARAHADRTKSLFAEMPAAMWASADLDDVDRIAVAAVEHGRTLAALSDPSAFAVQAPLIDEPTQPARVFRAVNALRYWRADAHRAAWAAAGLDVKEAQALNVLWDQHRSVERVGQGDPRPGRTGVASLTEKGYAADDAITEVGIKAREAIEDDTDARAEPIYATLGDSERSAFLEGLKKLPIG